MISTIGSTHAQQIPQPNAQRSVILYDMQYSFTLWWSRTREWKDLDPWNLITNDLMSDFKRDEQKLLEFLVVWINSVNSRIDSWHDFKPCHWVLHTYSSLPCYWVWREEFEQEAWLSFPIRSKKKNFNFIGAKGFKPPDGFWSRLLKQEPNSWPSDWSSVAHPLN